MSLGPTWVRVLRPGTLAGGEEKIEEVGYVLLLVFCHPSP